MSTPQSNIYICSGVPLNPRYEHSIYFASKQAQENYFAGKVVHTFSAYSYLRKTWPLQVQATMEQAKTWSYLYFHNGSGKVYYYFISQVEYKNDNMVELTLELDVLQTYLFDFDLLECFVERQHTPSDLIGEHTIDEDMELGELVTLESTDISMGSLSILVMATIVPNSSIGEDQTEPLKVLGSYYDGVFNGTGIFAVNATDWRALANILLLLDNNGFSDGIISIWMYPTKLIELDGDPDLVMRPVKAIAPFFEDFARPTSLYGGYTPKNKKLYSYPYNMLYVTNNTGGAGSFRYEKFGDPTACNFKIVGALSPEGNVRIYPLNYSGEQHAYEHGLTLAGFPTCAWNQDVYKLWLAQNQNQQDLSLALSALSIAGGVAGAVATGGAGAMLGLGSAMNGAQNIAGILAQRRDQQLQPPQAKGQSATSVNTVAGFQTFTVKKKTVDAQHARIIDDYFTMYGYKINRRQVPNIHARESFTYVKTIGCHIMSEMCTEDVLKIESIFDNGITFWANGDLIGDYAQDNACPTMGIISQPVSAQGTVGELVSFSVEAFGSDLTYHWEYMNPTNNRWLTAANVGDGESESMATIFVNVTEARNGYKFRCVITDTDGNTLYTDEVTLTVI